MNKAAFDKITEGLQEILLGTNGVGLKVLKPKGYPFPGEVVACFTTKSGHRRVVVEHDCGDLLHIFNPMQLELKP